MGRAGVWLDDCNGQFWCVVGACNGQCWGVERGSNGQVFGVLWVVMGRAGM